MFKKLFIFLFVINSQLVSAASFTPMLPFRLEHTSPALSKVSRFEISEKKSGKFEVKYSVVKKGVLQEKAKEFSEYIISQLFEKLKPLSTASSSDNNCIRSENWKLQFSSSRKGFCTNTKMINAIKDFQSSAELILKN